jgi:putrescine importer
VKPLNFFTWNLGTVIAYYFNRKRFQHITFTSLEEWYLQKTVTLKRSLGLWPIVMLGIGYMTPMSVFDTFGIASEATNGHVPTAYLIALIALLFTAFSYGKMVRAFPSAGSAYTYTQKTIHPNLGFLVGWSSLLDYLMIPMVTALLAKIYLAAVFPEIPEWLWVVGFVLILTSVNLIGLTTTSKLNTFLVLFQVIITVFFVILAVRALNHGMGYGGLFTVQPVFTQDMQFPLLVTGATILCFSFLGFDAVTTYSEETPNPTKTIPQAIFLTALIGGIIFVISSYFLQDVFPDDSVFNNPEAASPEIALFVGGKVFQLFFLAASVAAQLASGLTSHASVSRVLYVMGRDNVLPRKFFGYVHPKWRTPVFNVLLVGVVSLSALFFRLETAVSFISFGALIAFTFVNLSVIAHYAVKKGMYRTAKGFISYVIMPAIGASLVAILWYNLEPSAFMLGIGWAAVGFLYLLYVTKIFRVKPSEIAFTEKEGYQLDSASNY